MLTPRVEQWRAAGAIEEVAGRRLYVQRREGDGPLLLLLHGFPSSSYDWRELLALRPGRAALLFDCLGFGLSEKPRDHVYGLGWQADLTAEVVRRAGGGPAYLVAHDMGTSVATELLARDVEGRLPFRLDSVLLLNGSMVLERASLTSSQKLLRSRLGALVAKLSNERSFRAQFGRLFSPSHPLTEEEAADQWALLEYGGGNRILHRLTYYLHERVTYADRWHGALRDWDGELELAWGMLDPVSTEAVLAAVRALRPRAPVTRFAELGHYPQLEAAGAVAPIVARLAGIAR
jgi:pimeloyl-ACP methyl ester carboxylesterase